MYRFWTAGRKITCRPTPTVAAFGRVVNAGTSTEISLAVRTKQAKRQPSLISVSVNARKSNFDGSTSPLVTLIRHFLHVP
jgi:hypothetical protein